MKRSDYIVKSLINASAVFIYVCIVAWVLSNAEEAFRNAPKLFVPVFLLLLFIISASITGLLVLGKPIHLYLNGLKKEAFVLLFSTLGWLVIFLITVVVALVVQ